MSASSVSISRGSQLPIPAQSNALIAVALVAAIAISSIPIIQVIAIGTGQLGIDEPLSPGVASVSDVIHGLAYLVFAVVLKLRARDIDRESAVVRWIRRPLMVVFALYGALHVSLAFSDLLYTIEIASIIASVLFLALWVLCIALGFALLATRRRTPATFLLLAVLPALGLTIVLGVIGSPWGHPVYPEVAAHFGVALLALPQPRMKRHGDR